jgi:signal transduction histidine kinase
VELDDGFLALYHEMQVGDRVLLSITDTGPGMNEEVRSHVFEPFYITKHVREGSGLGLPVVYGSVLQSGENIKCRSEVGDGSVFEIHLPRLDELVELSLWGGGLATARA